MVRSTLAFARAVVRMDTVVIQSFHPGAPDWIARCMRSVRTWAARAGYEYRFAGDELFDRLPPSLAHKTRGRIQVASDIARLLWIVQLLDEGWSAVIWLDADVLVFDPDGLTPRIDRFQGELLGRETWVQHDDRGRIRANRGVHNALCAFGRDSSLLRFYLDAAQRVVERHQGPMVPQLVGPKLLTALDNLVGLPASWAVNMASSLVLADIVGRGGPALERFLARSGGRPAALNLCHSHVGRTTDAVAVDEELLEAAIDRLVSEGAAALG